MFFANNLTQTRMGTKEFLWVVILCSFFIESPSFAQNSGDKLEAVGRQLLSNSNVNHTEYRRCLTTKGYNCAHSNAEYKKIEAHGPSIADTLAWIGDQLTTRKLVELYQVRGCKIAVDITNGTPASLMWLENKDGKRAQLSRSIISPPREDVFKATWFGGNGFYSFMKKNHRENGSAESPKRVSYFNDAGLFDLAKTSSTKSHVITDEKGDLVLRDKPASKFRFNFYRDDADQIIGTQFDDETSIFSVGPSAFPKAGKTLDIFNDQYVPFETREPNPMFILQLTPNDVDFALNIAKAFRHAIELCELGNNKPSEE